MSAEPEVRKIVLLPRFTSFSGAETFHSAPMNIREFASAIVAVWVGNPIGSSTSFSLKVQESPDLEFWDTLATISPTAGTESTADVEFGLEWMRLEIAVAGTDPAYTGWCVGNFVTRVHGA